MSDVIRERSAEVRRSGEIDIYICTYVYTHGLKLARVPVVPGMHPLYLQSP